MHSVDTPQRKHSDCFSRWVTVPLTGLESDGTMMAQVEVDTRELMNCRRVPLRTQRSPTWLVMRETTLLLRELTTVTTTLFRSWDWLREMSRQMTTKPLSESREVEFLMLFTGIRQEAELNLKSLWKVLTRVWLPWLQVLLLPYHSLRSEQPPLFSANWSKRVTIARTSLQRLVKS